MTKAARRGIAAFAASFLLVAGAFAVSDIYWDDPAPFVEGAGRFPVSSFRDGLSAVAWQESEPTQDGTLSVRVSVAVKRTGGPWRVRRAVAGPYVFSGSEPAVASVAVDGRGRIVLAATASQTVTEVLVSADEGATFSRARVNGGSETSVGPRVFAASDGGYLLFVTRGGEQSISIYLSRSADGAAWSPFRPFVDEDGFRLNFLPTHTAAAGSDLVVFQSFSSSDRPTFQLFSKASADGGATWSPARLVTGFADPFAQTRPQAEFFDNQRPHLSTIAGEPFLVWERRSGAGAPQVYAVSLTADGLSSGEVERLSSPGTYANNPVAFEFGGEASVLWFDNRRGQNRVYFSQRDGLFWQDTDISGARGEASFARAAVDGDGLYVFWQAPLRGADRIYLRPPDKTVPSVALEGLNFAEGARSRSAVARFGWKLPDDPSGIAGFSWSWSEDPAAVPPRKVMESSSFLRAELDAPQDGTWYFSVAAQDYAGNWSRPSRLAFVRDTTPPPTAHVLPPPLDEAGFLASNTFTVDWAEPPASDLMGYTWRLEYAGEIEGSPDEAQLAALVASRLPPPSPSPRIMGTSSGASYANLDDGAWRFSVSAVDQVGNIGPPAVAYFKANKYVPYTIVTFADASRDDMGVLSLRILGRGFAVGGRVGRVFLDRDGKPPYDREFLLERGDFRILGDREMSGFRAEDLEEGTYRIGIEHPRRGLYLTGPLVAVDESGTIKFGDFSREWVPSWRTAAKRRFVVDAVALALIAAAVFGALGLFVSIRGIGDVARESAALRSDVAALITGDIMPSEKKARAAAIRKRGGGLRLKLASFTTFLVVVVVVLVSVPLSVLMTRTQEETLLRGLKDRSAVLLESLAAGARAYLPAQNVLELGFLPSQTAAVPEARYATITGFGSEATVFGDHVWASNDPDLATKIDTPAFQAGTSRLKDALSPKADRIAAELDDRARAEVGQLSAEISTLTQDGLKLALRTDAESVRRRDEIQATTRVLEARLTERLNAIAVEIGSEPAFPLDKIDSGAGTYIFFKPVMFRRGSEDTYFRGLVRLEVSTASIAQEIAAGRGELLRITGVVALAALGLGVLGALLLSAIIIRPIKRLVAHVETIRDTEDKADLAGKDIRVDSKDELSVLGDTINEMTHGLVKAAMASQDLTIGKEVQKMFIPLETDSGGRKLTCGRTDTPGAEFFGYYEGAKGVSGDYFDYLKLDDRYFAVIKCDVAGKGVPAALIMVEVATLFLNFFKNWRPTKEGLRIDRVVYQINDFIETRGFKGRFAAFTLCLFDSKTGDVRFCNAGDNIVHWYDASERKIRLTTLPESPTAGVFPNDLIEMKGGYGIQTLHLDPGDTLLLYTDGIEEAKRKFRDPSFKEMECSEGGLPKGSPHFNHVVGQADEEFGYDRVAAILDAVFSKGRFDLVRHHDPEGAIPLGFDFSRLAGSVEDAIMALVSVEKIFRMYRDPAAGEDSRVVVDRKVDAFLENCFDQYRAYSSYKKDWLGHPEYVYYCRVKEDEQYDDLTILGICKK